MHYKITKFFGWNRTGIDRLKYRKENKITHFIPTCELGTIPMPKISPYPNKFFIKLFSPANIGKMRLANRIVMPGMGTNMSSATGEVTDSLIAYHEERARGGTGLIIVEHGSVDYSRGQAGETELRIDDNAFIPGLHRLVEAVHQWDTKICIQINHAGAAAKKTADGPFGPSAFRIYSGALLTKELTVADIADIIEKFGQAALRVKRAGFDAVEIHGAHIYLISQFLSPFTNKRTDEYGGDMSGRMKLALNVVKRVRSAVGDDFPILFRFSGDDFLPGGVTIAESKILARSLEEASVDALDVSAGGPSRDANRSRAATVEPMSYAQGWRSYLAAEIKEVVSIPVISAGVIREPEFAEGLLEQGKTDFVAVGRGLIADPEWPLKAKEGRSDRIRKCTSCLENCQGNRSYRSWPLRCTINAAAGREKEFSELSPVKRSKFICVVGGGPAGMEFARIAACRGHHVILYEKEDYLGGQVRLASLPPGKEKLRWVIDYLTKELEATGAEVRMGYAVTPAEILKMKCDTVIVATGAESIVPEGFLDNGIRKITVHDVLAGRVEVKKQNVVVLGGGSSGCETACYLAQENKVTVVEMTSEAASGLLPTPRWDLLNKLDEYRVPILLKTKVLKAMTEGVIISTENDSEKLFPCDCVVLALGVKSVNNLASEIDGKVPELYVIGDAKLPGRIGEAIYEANIIGRRIA